MLVTGASGFIGWHVADRLVAGRRAGARVWSGRRRPQRSEAFEWVEGDLLRRESLDAAVRGCRYVFHVAGDYRFWARDPREIFANNVQGTINMLEAAKAAGVERIVYTSTTGILERGTADRLATEDAAGFAGRVQRPLQTFEVRSLPRSAIARRCRLADRHRAADGADRPA